MHSRNSTQKPKMFLKKYLFLNFFFACVINFRSGYGLDLKNRKQIYHMYVSMNKFEGIWIDPHSLGIFDGDIEFEDSYTLSPEEMTSNKEKKLKNHENFSRDRIWQKKEFQDDSGSGGIFMTEDNTIFSQAKNLMTNSAIITFGVFILLSFIPTRVIFSYVLILSILWHWMKLYQEKIAEKQSITENLRHPNECRRADLHWYEVIYLYLSSFASSETDCNEYYKARLVDPFWEVSLPVAMMNAFTSTVCELMKVFATTVRFCLVKIFSGLTLLELSIALFFIFMVMLINYRYSFSFCWGAISLNQPQNSWAVQTASPSFSCWGSVKNFLRTLFLAKSVLNHSSRFSALPDNKMVGISNKDDKVTVSETAVRLQKQEKCIDIVQQGATLQSKSLNLKKNNRIIVGLNISQFRKRYKKSFKKKYEKNRKMVSSKNFSI